MSVTEEVAEPIAAENAVTTEEVEETAESHPASEAAAEPPASEEITVPSPPPVVATVPPPPQAPPPEVYQVQFLSDIYPKGSNETLDRSEKRVSVSLYMAGKHCAEYSSIMKVRRDLPAPVWFCQALGTLENHHGNVKFFVSEQLRKLIGYHYDNVITHSQFIGRLWKVMSFYPLNEEEFIPVPAFLAAFGKEFVLSQGYPVKWSKNQDQGDFERTRLFQQLSRWCIQCKETSYS